MFSPLEQFDSILLISFRIFSIDVSLTSILLPLCIANILVFSIIEYVLNHGLLVPNSLQIIFEDIYNFVLDILEQQVGHKGYIYFPFIFSLFFFVLICNLISMTPFGIALTSHLIIIIFLSLSLGLSIFIIGLVTNNLEFLKIFVPECPFALLPFLMLIEMFSYTLRTFSLAIRLSANIMAGHTLVYIISSFILNMTVMKFWFFLIFVSLILAVLLLEVGVAFLQAYVFTILVCIYLSDSLKTPGH